MIRYCASFLHQPSHKRHTNEEKCEEVKENGKKKNKANGTIETIKGNKFYRRLNRNNSNHNNNNYVKTKWGREREGEEIGSENEKR